MFTESQVQALQANNFAKVNTHLYGYQNVMIFSNEDNFSVIFAQNNKFISHDFKTFKEALKFIEAFKFPNFTKKQVEALQGIKFKEVYETMYQYKGISLLSLRDCFSVRYLEDGWAHTEKFNTFQEAFNFVDCL